MQVGKKSIGQVLAVLKPDYPDISISKIRFLESEGLLAPERAPSGYRRYSDTDIERLRYVLDMQKNHYLPLKVIRENLDLMDRGVEPPVLEPTPSETPTEVREEEAVPVKVVRPGGSPMQQQQRRPIRLTRRELLDVSGLSEAHLADLERQALILPRRGTHYYNRDALTIAVAARKLTQYGMDARHLRVVKQSAEREVSLVEQAIAPFLRGRTSATESSQEVFQLVLHVHAAIMRSSMVH